MTAIRVVAPFRPLPAEYDHHKALTTFDWMDAIRMLSRSVERSCGVPVQVITDVDTTLPMPSLQYHTTRRRLMLWYLEVAACYLESPDFDRDTVMLDSDQLVFADLARWFVPGMDLGILVRPIPKGGGFPILNGVQFWARSGGARLAAFYRQALALAETLPESDIAWGADTIVLEQLLAPLEPVDTLVERADLRVHLIPADAVIERLSGRHIRQLTARTVIDRSRPVLDFRNMRKVYMRPVFDALLRDVVPA